MNGWWPERQPNTSFTLQTVSGESHLILKEVLLTHPGEPPAENLDFRHRYQRCAHLGTGPCICGHRAPNATTSRGRDIVTEPRRGPRPSILVVAKDHVIPAQCEGIVMTRMQNPLGVENGLVEPRLQAHPPEGIYIARTFVQDRQKVPVRVFKAHEIIPPSALWASSTGNSARVGVAPVTKPKLKIRGRNHSGQARTNQRRISGVGRTPNRIWRLFCWE
jgi:hypothetical protein